MASSTIATSDNQSWVSECNRFLNEMCAKFDLDISNNRRIELLMEIVVTKKVLVNEEMLDYLGYSGQYSKKKRAFARLLLKHPNIQYEEILDEKDMKKTNYILSVYEFECAILRKSRALAKLIYFITCSRMKYLEDQKIKTEEEKRRAEECSQDYGELLERCSHVLLNDIAPRVTPTPINKLKIRCFGLFATSIPGEWYLMRRQMEAWDRSQRELEARKMSLLKKWEDVSHAVDIGNAIKLYSREELSWYAKDNLIKVNQNAEESFDDDCIVQMVTNIVEQRNDADKLASEIELKLMHHGYALRDYSGPEPDSSKSDHNSNGPDPNPAMDI